MNIGIYKITNKKSGKFYIGSSDDLNKRKYDHFYELRNGTHINTHLKNAYNKDGEENFIFEVIEECGSDELLIREQYYLDTLKPFRENGYNIATTVGGGNIFKDLSDEQKLEFINKSKRVGTENGMYGKNHLTNTIEKQKLRAIGRYTLEWFVTKYGSEDGNKLYQERSKNMSEKMSSERNHFFGKVMNGSRFKGKKHSDETKKKMWESRKTIKDDDLFMEMIKNKSLSLIQIAEHFDVSDQTVRYHCKKITGYPPTHFRQ